LEKSKFHGKNASSKDKKAEVTTKPSYMQISPKIINNILKIKEIFLELLNEKIKYFNKLIFNNSGISKCYKTRVWTDFRVRVRTIVNY